MKRNLTAKETITITSMLFGMFFGAGNLIFPAILGVQAGSNFWSAFAGVFITAVGIPMLAVVALGISRSQALLILEYMDRCGITCRVRDGRLAGPQARRYEGKGESDHG